MPDSQRVESLDHDGEVLLFSASDERAYVDAVAIEDGREQDDPSSFEEHHEHAVVGDLDLSLGQPLGRLLEDGAGFGFEVELEDPSDHPRRHVSHRSFEFELVEVAADVVLGLCPGVLSFELEEDVASVSFSVFGSAAHDQDAAGQLDQRVALAHVSEDFLSFEDDVFDDEIFSSAELAHAAVPRKLSSGLVVDDRVYFRFAA